MRLVWTEFEPQIHLEASATNSILRSNAQNRLPCSKIVPVRVSIPAEFLFFGMFFLERSGEKNLWFPTENFRWLYERIRTKRIVRNATISQSFGEDFHRCEIRSHHK